MPGENIQDWSPTSADNANSDTLINWAEGQPRASVNNSARSMMAAHAKNRNLLSGSITTTGSANAQAFTSGVGYSSVPTGLRVLLKIGYTNLGPVTLDMDGIGAVVIKSIYGNPLAGGELVANAYHEFLYDGTNWLLIVNPAAHVLLSAVTSSGASFVDFTGLFTGAYIHYIFDCAYNIGTPNSQMLMLVSTDNGVTWVVANYLWSFMYVSLVAPSGSMAAASTSAAMPICPVVSIAGLQQHSVVDVMSVGYQFFRSWGYGGAPGNYTMLGSGLPGGGVTAINGVRFVTGAGPFNGTFKMYGARP